MVIEDRWVLDDRTFVSLMLAVVMREVGSDPHLVGRAGAHRVGARNRGRVGGVDNVGCPPSRNSLLRS